VTAAVLIVQHGDDCPPVRVGRWLTEAGRPVRVVRGQRGEPFPDDLDGVAGLVVLGGQMGAYDDAEHPWLTPTKRLLALAVAHDVPTLGICLGHQLLAVACGGTVRRAERRQVGVIPIGLTPEGRADPLLGTLPTEATAVHSNGDLVVEPPSGARVLARSAAGIQAMRVGSAVGLQFHPEVDPSTVRVWLAGYVASGALAREDADRHLATIGAADAELERTWRGFTRRFAALVRTDRSGGPTYSSGSAGSLMSSR